MATTDATRGWLKAAGLSAFLIAAGWYLAHAIPMRFGAPGKTGPDLLNRQLWFWLHMAAAIPAVLIGPAQFSRRLRAARPMLHRRLGQIYVVCAALAAAAALPLAALTDLANDRPALLLLAMLWLFFTLAAWACARRRDFVNHRLFMIRSYGAVLAFVSLRAIAEAPVAGLFPDIKDPVVLDTVETWLGSAGLVILVELLFAWIPAARGRSTRGA